MNQVQTVPQTNANFEPRKVRKAELPKPKGRHSATTLKKLPIIKGLEGIAQASSTLPTPKEIAETETLCVNDKGLISVKPTDRRNARTLILSAYGYNNMAQIEFCGKVPDDTSVGLVIRALKAQGGIEATLIFEGKGHNAKIMTIQPTGRVTICEKPITVNA